MARTGSALVAVSITAFLGFVSPLSASTIVVDAAGGPGSQFVDIPPAILAAAPDDLILVRPGSYSAFTVDKRLTILGQGNVLSAGITVQNTIGVQRVVIAGLRASRVDVTNCAAPVILQDVRSLGTFAVTSSADVRALRATVQPGNVAPGPFDAVTCEQSRLELVSSDAVAASPQFGSHFDGGLGIQARAGAWVHAALTSARGGTGASQSVIDGGSAGDAGAGVRTSGGGFARIDGSGLATVEGGAPGVHFGYSNDCSHDGWGAPALHVWVPSGGGTIEYSLTTLIAYPWLVGSHCVFDPAEPTTFGCVERSPAGATLELVGAAIAGSPIVFTLRGEPGSLATWWFGRQAIVQADPAADLELLAPRGRMLVLGAVPSGTPVGALTFAIQLPSTIPAGAVFVCQAECVDTATGQIRRTNSIPIVVR